MIFLIAFLVGLGLGFFGHDMALEKLKALKDKIAAKL